MDKIDMALLRALRKQVQDRSMAFELMAEFFDRAERENNLLAMQETFEIMAMIHRGGEHGIDKSTASAKCLHAPRFSAASGIGGAARD